MPRRRRPSSTTNDRNTNYTVGYGKPPQPSRFRPGQSGNPTGRRKGVRNLGTDVRHALTTPVRMSSGGRSRNVSTQQATLMVLRERALNGDARACDRLIELARRFNDGPGEIEAHSLAPEDRAILAAHEEEIRAAVEEQIRAAVEEEIRAAVEEEIRAAALTRQQAQRPRIKRRRLRGSSSTEDASQ
jgi:hypothetical protein